MGPKCVRRRVLPLLVATAVGTLAGARPVPAAEDVPASDVQLSADAAFAKEFDPGDHVVISVSVSAAGLVAGEVVVRNPDTKMIVAQPIEVAGGSAKQLDLVVPTNNSSPVTFEVAVTAGGDTVASDKVVFLHTALSTVAGVLPELAARTGELPEQVPLAPGLGVVRLATVTPAQISLGVEALDQFDTLLGTSGDVAGLTAAQRAQLYGWVAGGGRLLLDDADLLDALPAAWKPGTEPWRRAGAGEVALTEGAAARGDWANIIEPTEPSIYDAFMTVPEAGGGDPTASLARRSGVTTPDLEALLLVLVAYAVFIGPVLYLALRRARRLVAAWYVIPAAALLVGGVVLVVGRSWSGSGRTATSEIVESNPAGAVVSTTALVFSRGGGEVSLQLPAAWAAGEAAWFGFDDSERRQEFAGEASRLSARAESGQVVVLRSVGTSDAAGLTVTAHAEGAGVVSGTVTNDTATRLDAVTVFLSGRGKLLGALEAGASAEFRVENVPVHVMEEIQFGSSDVYDIWQGLDPSLCCSDASRSKDVVDFGIWSELSARQSSGMYQSGSVRAIGWTDSLPSEVDPQANARTGVSTIVPIETATGKIDPVSVRTEVVSVPDGFGNGGQDARSVVRFVLPNGAPPGDLVLGLPGWSAAADLLVDGEWRSLEVNGSTALIPRSAVPRGSLLVRLRVGDFGFDVSQLPTITGATS